MFRTLTVALALFLLTLAPEAVGQPGLSGSASGESDARLGLTPIESSVLYEVNLRQYTPEGTINAFRQHLPRLKEMGVDILWLMPIHPIGEEKRKGELGSYYAVQDYYAVNPELGTIQDFDALVADARKLGMRVILDWVANHTAWDHEWVAELPWLYKRDADGKLMPPNEDWDDVVALDYAVEDTQNEMLRVMQFWVKEHRVDGFRCDVAESVPQEFWERSIRILENRYGDLFFLAEGGAEWLYEAGFDATYGWGLTDSVAGIHEGTADLTALRTYARDGLLLPARRHPEGFRMHFTSNHDWNSWNGTAIDRLGEAWEVATVLTFTLPGMPMIYSGQESGLDKQLEFFERDPIEWREEHPATDLYQRLIEFKQRTPALRHGDPGTRFNVTRFGEPDQVFSFVRRSADSSVTVMVNLTGKSASLFGFVSNPEQGYRDIDGNPAEIPVAIEPWGWVILEWVDG